MNQQVHAEASGTDELLDAIGMTEDQLLARLDYLEFGDTDVKLLSGLHEDLRAYWQQFGERFYAYLNSRPTLQPYLDARSLEKLKEHQSTYFSSLSSGCYDGQYVRNRIAVGLTHQRIGLAPEWYLGAYRKYLVELVPILWKICGNDFARFEAAFGAMAKIVFFDIGIALDTYFAAGRKAIDATKHHEEQLVFHATHDTLTGLPNRILLREHLQEAIAQADRDGQVVALLLLDIDDFKLINDSIEHAGGDRLLQALAQRLSSRIPAAHLLSRHGGDEFALVFNLATPSPNLSAICKNIAAIVAAPFAIDDRALQITCSLGVALYPVDAKDVPSLLKYADIALFHAKESGRNSCQFFSSEMNRRLQERMKLESELRSAIGKNELRLHYQPLVDLQTGQLVSLEALVRWQHPVLGLIPPMQFIPLAEDSDLIADIGDWVLHQACRDLLIWNQHGFPNLRVAINVSPKQFRDANLAAKVEQALAGAGIEPALLALEITETALMQNTPSSEAALRRLKDLGLSLALDDFGTGYSSLSYLKHFPFDRVKIDRSFIEGLATNADDAALTRAIISMAHSLGIKVVAEGVETEEQCDFLRRHMCDEIQGFFYSTPLPPKELETLLLEGRHLPDHLLRLQKPPRTLLLVDDEANILASLKRLLRRDGYQILAANSGQEGLDLLARHEVDVIVSDQRMPGMTGVEFLRTAKGIYPNTVRIVLSGYTELQSVTDAVNEGSIYKFLTKPWDDRLLREHIEEAFRHKEMADENRRLDLQVRTANQELAIANRQMEEHLRQKQQQITRTEVSLEIVREILQHVPTPLLGLDESGMVAFANDTAEALFAPSGSLLGSDVRQFLPELFEPPPGGEEHSEGWRIRRGNAWFNVTTRPMGEKSQSTGKLISLTKCECEQ